MQDDQPYARPYRVSTLPAKKPTHFALTPDGPERAAIAAWLGISDLRKAGFEGTITPAGRHDWLLEGKFRATVVQPCIVTLAPVATEIAGPVRRRYLADMPDPEGDEMEMPEDDTQELLGAEIDPGLVLVEEIALALPPYPRAPGAELGSAQFAEPGVAALGDDDVKPFAGLSALKARLEDKG